MNEPTYFANVLDKLVGVKRSGAGYSALCPAHEDSMNSLSASLGTTGAVVFNCHRGCTAQDVAAAIGFEMRDLWPDDKPIISDGGVKTKTFIESYQYHDAEGTLIFEVSRFAYPDGKKSFTQRQPDGEGGWLYQTSNIVNKPLYRLPNVTKAIKDGDPIYITEGEKDVHTLESFGLTATTNSGGAKNWQPHHTDTLRNAKQIFIVPDNDAAGRNLALTIAQQLDNATILAVPDQYTDVTDLIDKGGQLSDLTEPDWTPQQTDPYHDLLANMRSVGNEDWTYERKLAHAKTLITAETVEILDTGTLQQWDTFLQADVEPYEWIIPNLLERMDRVIIVAAEGVGKTMLGRQMSLLSAGGINPITRVKMDPIRTLFLDFENPERIIRRTSKPMYQQLRKQNPYLINIPAALYTKPDGINLLTEPNQTLIEQIVQQTRPDLIVAGPLYKMYIDPGGRTSESVTTEIAMWLDHLRTTYNCALWLEHHAPLGSSQGGREMRPFGSSVWSRWPEFGIGILKDPTIPHRYELKPFRGGREEREWPTALHRDDIYPFRPEWS